MIHLDTSFLIRAFQHGSAEDKSLRSWLTDGDSLAMSCVAWAEFLCGPVEIGHIELATQLVKERLTFNEDDAESAAILYNQTGRHRRSLADCMIAATAIRLDAPLATSNPGHFKPLEALGLQLKPLSTTVRT